MGTREHAAIVTRHTCKLGDDAFFHFGDKNGLHDYSEYDRRFGYSSGDVTFGFQAVREVAAGATQQYATGWTFDFDEVFFCGTGVQKSWGMYLSGDRPDTAVMGGDANDMVLRLGYTNYAVNTPAGSYARGFDISLNNKTAGAITGLEGAFISVRQRSTGAIAVLEGLQIDAKVDSGKAAITSEITGTRVEFDICANAPTASYGFVARNRTDGVYTVPTAAFKVINDGTSGCKGWNYGLDLYGSAARTALADIRLTSADSDGLGGLILSGAGTDDAGIKADLTARGISAAHGSLYLSIVKTGGKAFVDKNGTWTEI